MDKVRSSVPTPETAPPDDRAGHKPPTTRVRRWLGKRKWGYILTGFWTVIAAGATALDLGIAELLERQTQTLLFEIRGPVPAPKDVVILAIDDASLAQAEFYRDNPEQYSYLQPIEAWPWHRNAYAIAIEKLVQAGARAVAVDVVFSSDSTYGAEDDQQLIQALQQYGDRVALAAQYTDGDVPQGVTTGLRFPTNSLRTQTEQIGLINFLVESNGRIHRLGEQFVPTLIQQSSPREAEVLRDLVGLTPTLATATLQAAQLDPPTNRGTHIFFYGPAQQFEQVPFWYVLDPMTWRDYLQSGQYFKDKIVLIGSTADLHQDFHATPFSNTWFYPQPMAGVEVHANAIATLLQGKAIRELIPQAPVRGLVVLLGVAATGWLLGRPRQLLVRWVWATGLAIAWLIAGYILFVSGRIIVPTGVPVVAIALSGFSQLLAGVADEQFRKQRLRDTLKQYATSPVVREIISQQDDLRDLLRERELAISGKILSGRYRIVKVLGAGGFSETYVAQDLQRPGNPPCVVKQLKVVSRGNNTLKLARRLFDTEAEALERLGQHDRIPRLMASFEENHEFYLVQEYIPGRSLADELFPRRVLPERGVIVLLHELLKILEFVHGQGVIHRDLKPSNIIRRKSDSKLVLIDFGVAKKITTELLDSAGTAQFTIAVGTPGYMSSEQSAGRPHFSSDIYALGMIGIEALTGRPPHLLNHDAFTGEVHWRDHAGQASAELVTILTKMVRYDLNQRYKSAREARVDLENMVDVPSCITSAIAPTDDPEPDATATEAIDASLEDASEPLESSTTIALPDDWMDES